MRRVAILSSLLPVLLAAACSTADGTDLATDGADDTDLAADGADPVPDLPDVEAVDDPACSPGEPRGECSADLLGRVVCAPDGSGWVVEACGEDSACLYNGKCTACRPGNRKCKDDDTVLRCDETGSAYVKALDCNGYETGQVCRLGACARLCDLNSKVQSYIGCEYWGVDLDNAFVPGGGEGGYYDASNAQYAIVVSNTSPKYPARVQVFQLDEGGSEVEVASDSHGDPLPAEPIPPMGLRIYGLGPRNLDSTGVYPLAYRVVSSIPITAYQFNPLDNVNVFSNDATVLLPSNALGKYHIVMTREQTFDDLKGFLTVVATYDGETQVTVTVTAPTLGDNGIDPMAPGESRAFVLRRYEALNIETDAYGADLTGSIVYSNHPVAVFGGSEASNAPNTTHCCPGGECAASAENFFQPWLACADRDDCLCEWPRHHMTPPQDVPCRNNYQCIKYNTCCADHLEMQIYPVKAWGTTYVATRSWPRGGERDVWRILGAADQTAFTTFPSQLDVPVIDRGGWVDFESGDDFEVFAKKPVLVGQFLAAQDAPDPNVSAKGANDAETGDPTFMLAVPVEQFRTEYVFLAPDKYAFDAINLVVPAGVPVFLDGTEVRDEGLQFAPAKEILKQVKDAGVKGPTELGPRWGQRALVGTGAYEVWRLVVADGVHVAQCVEPFGVIAYGYDQYVSYGYPAGLNLDDLKLVSEVP
jgi:hypothetical protein